MTDAMLEDMQEDMHEGEVYRRVEVITGCRRRLDWTAEQKARIVAESFRPGANISEVARRNGVHRGLLSVWRKQARVSVMAGAPAPLFAAVQIEDEAAVHDDSAPAARKSVRPRPDLIIMELSGATVRVPNGVDPATLAVLIHALRGAS
jgi:transposase